MGDFLIDDRVRVTFEGVDDQLEGVVVDAPMPGWSAESLREGGYVVPVYGLASYPDGITWTRPSQLELVDRPEPRTCAGCGLAQPKHRRW